MKAFCAEEGIAPEPTVPDSPWQDGVSERSIRIIVAMARSMFFALIIPLPKSLWAEAIDAAVFMLNRLPTSVPLWNDDTPDGIDRNPNIKPSPHITPESAWFNVPPNIANVRKWGCPTMVHLHGSKQPDDKLSPRSKLCHLVGYESSTIYRVWDPESKTVFRTTDVEFDEFATAKDRGVASSAAPGTFAGTPTAPVLNPVGENPSNFHSASQLRDIARAALQNQSAATPAAVALQDDAAGPSATALQAYTESLDRILPFTDSDDLLGHWLRPAKNFEAVALAAATVEDIKLQTPRTFKRALVSPNSDEWIKAMLREIELLEKKRCWELVLRADIEPNVKVLPGRWVYKTKMKDDGSLLYKARWVIRGDLIRRPRIQGGDLDSEETYAPVVDPTTTKVLFAAAAFHGWTILQADAVLAFLNGTLPKPSDLK